MDASSPAVAQRRTVFRSLDVEETDGLVELDGRKMYRICRFDEMPPFLMTLVSDSDLWMYVSSTGALTAGRVNEDRALFPYETDDRLHCHHHFIGPLTMLRVRRRGEAPVLWQPFSDTPSSALVSRNLYKSISGDAIVFEEVNQTLGLTFRYQWSAVDAFGFIRQCTLVNQLPEALDVDILDGLQNLLPAGADLRVQQRSSCLVNAYTRCEVDPQTMLGIFAMTSLICDRPEPAESLHANVVWCHGLSSPRVLLSRDQILAFRTGAAVRPESPMKGRRASYLACSQEHLVGAEGLVWHVVADAHLSQEAVTALITLLRNRDNVAAKLAAASQARTVRLEKLFASADAQQLTGDVMSSAHHFVNVLFNCMRGGVFLDNGRLSPADLVNFVRHRNRDVHASQAKFFESLPQRIVPQDLGAKAQQSKSSDLVRLCLEYLPLTFSRRHGDPSRPWNRFSIRVRNDDASPALSYQGNWRDIFQNWEALATSFPQYLPNIIAKFVNASTIDGFNPYRITRGGIEWEVADPEDPWSNIGYWGDHQIIYLLKFLEAGRRACPNGLVAMLSQSIFTYADVPYRMKPFDQILGDRWSTITFDAAASKRVEQRVKAIGSDGKLLPARGDGVYHVTLLEKLLVPALSKLSNLVVDGGIWMNTQRPEWNDANNALVGNGLSMVTLCYLRRYCSFCLELLQQAGDLKAAVSREIIEWFDRVANILHDNMAILDTRYVTDAQRARLLNDLGHAFCDYRGKVYRAGFSDRQPLSARAAAGMFRTALRYLDHSIDANRRADGLYHAYNLMRPAPHWHEMAIDRLDEMLEGQVAAISSGALPPADVVGVCESLFSSRLYRADQLSFMLYPDRELPGFLDKNRIEEAEVMQNPLLAALAAAHDRSMIVRDACGEFRFHPSMRNGRDLEKILDRLAVTEPWAILVQKHRIAVAELYEEVFHHRSFTGRSGSMYGYEGLGCIYWHMVSKLLLAVQETHSAAVRAGEKAHVVAALANAYYRIRGGLGFNKSPREYGAFPLDPYSHSPKHAGAQQPGMTGQVKEEILTRFGELGVAVNEGTLRFAPRLLRRSEFLLAPQDWHYYDINGHAQQLKLAADCLAFTFCQTPIVYRLSAEQTMRIRVFHRGNGEPLTIVGDCIDRDATEALTSRSGAIERLEVCVPQAALVT